jgi:hypothetical protein
MADYYTQTSFMLPLLDEMEESQLEEWCEKHKKRSEETQDKDEWQDEYGGILFDYLKGEGVWVRHDESANLSSAEFLARDYLYHFNLEGGVYIPFSEGCSKPSLDGYRGGAMLVTAGSTKTVYSHDAIWYAEANNIKVLND